MRFFVSCFFFPIEQFSLFVLGKLLLLDVLLSSHTHHSCIHGKVPRTEPGCHEWETPNPWHPSCTRYSNAVFWTASTVHICNNKGMAAIKLLPNVYCSLTYWEINPTLHYIVKVKTPMLFRLSCCIAVQLQGSQIANAAKLSSESDTSRLSELYVISAALCFVPSDVHSCKPVMFQVYCISIFKPLKLTKHHNLPSFMHGPIMHPELYHNAC